MDLEETRYEGPTGIVGILQEACTHAGVPAVSLWAAVPHYVSQPPNPKATLALLNRLEDLIDLRIPLGELPEDARAWQLGVDQLAAEDSEVAEYVQSLEEARDTAELPEASGEAIAREFERYLRRRDGGGPAAAGRHATGRRRQRRSYLRDTPERPGRTRPPSRRPRRRHGRHRMPRHAGSADPPDAPEARRRLESGAGAPGRRRRRGGAPRCRQGDAEGAPRRRGAPGAVRRGC